MKIRKIERGTSEETKKRKILILNRTLDKSKTRYKRGKNTKNI